MCGRNHAVTFPNNCGKIFVPQRRTNVLRRDQPNATELMTKTLLPLAGLEEVLRYEPEAGKLFWLDHRGTRRSPGDKAGGLDRTTGYIIVKYKGKGYRAHRLAWYLHTGEDPATMWIDHINGNPVDNRILNLRKCLQSQNRCNSRAKANSTSGYKGVYWCKRNKKYRAQITKNKKVYKLGNYDNPQEAHMAYCIAAVQMHGDFANFG